MWMVLIMGNNKYLLITRWVDPEVCKRHNIPMKNGESLPVPHEKEVESDDELELKSLKPIKTKRFSVMIITFV